MGDSLEGEHSSVGVGRESPVSDDDVIIEQPRDFDNENEADTREGLNEN